LKYPLKLVIAITLNKNIPLIRNEQHWNLHEDLKLWEKFKDTAQMTDKIKNQLLGRLISLSVIEAKYKANFNIKTIYQNAKKPIE